MHTAKQVKEALFACRIPEKQKVLSGFFKTGKNQYGEGDVFIGCTVPDQRKVAKAHLDISYEELEILLKSEIHEHRLTALLILTYQYEKADATKQKKIYHFTLHNRKAINNWDLVDLTAPKIIGVYMLEHPQEKNTLYIYATSKDLWERRIAMVSTWAFIRAGELEDTWKLAEILLHDDHDLIHKAVGWMLREAGKKDQAQLETFLETHHKDMPRTMLRYALEKLPEGKRRYFMKR